MLGWSLFLLALTCYCLIYKQVLFATSLSWAIAWETLIWACREWAVWLVLTPAVFLLWRDRQQTARSLRRQWLWCAGLLAIALLARIGLDLISSTGDEVISLVILFPRYLAASLVVMLVWRLYLRPQVAAPTDSTAPANTSCPDSIMVSKGNGQTLLAIDKIQWLGACGNYVEVHTFESSYLLRATMQQLQDRLPAERFLRIHRSYMVNRQAIYSITGRPSGSGDVTLKNGRTLALSKSYRKALQQFKIR
ncbi:LytR/AlgR family response regulator transcription factor [Lacimicrobium alkaliphilum]|uniref:HTH LytTR-type domain-containing protein n=1 Tax=Lacimicrobium alkaliphilum TaxID=1526571 RepID=A0A0U3B3Y3_9ALTE|nr:LytTR family DNA-binding domain-containing protein [Lacimicrobium alkaliphilum]ALS98249.1 hypothetical protein AT746_08305 [Lacimicrobium alkaliphilum]